MNIFISGIDTDCGKTICTGLISKYLLSIGKKSITQKPIQTGCQKYADDILTHRKIENRNLLEEDTNGLTCRYLFNYPASPHLSAKMENTIINPFLIKKDSQKLEQNYDIVLTEGAGGLMVPMVDNYYTIDYIQQYNLPLILITSSKLGSINHTILSIEACKKRNINIIAVLYNYLPNWDKIISPESSFRIKEYTKFQYPKSKFYEVPTLTNIDNELVKFENII